MCTSWDPLGRNVCTASRLCQRGGRLHSEHWRCLYLILPCSMYQSSCKMKTKDSVASVSVAFSSECDACTGLVMTVSNNILLIFTYPWWDYLTSQENYAHRAHFMSCGGNLCLHVLIQGPCEFIHRVCIIVCHYHLG